MPVRTFTRRGTGGVGAGAPTAIYEEEFNLDDKVGVSPVLPDALDLSDFLSAARSEFGEQVTLDDLLRVDAAGTWQLQDFELTDAFASRLALPEPLTVEDFLSSIKHSTPESLNIDDRTIAVGLGAFAEAMTLRESKAGILIDDAVVPADSWVEEANPDTNRGNDPNMFAAADLPVGTQGARMYFKFDFRNAAGNIFANLSDDSVSRNIQFEFRIRQPSALGKVCNVYARISAADPFSEGIITWNNKPALGTKVADVSVGPNNVYENKSISLGASFETDDLLGNWLQLAINVDDVAVLDTFEALSSEHATATDRPRVTFRLRRVV